MADLAWQVAGVGDFDGDGRADILWRNASTGGNTYWKGGNSANQVGVSGVTGSAWKIVAVADYNGDGRADVFWRNTGTGANVVWRSANGATTQAVATVTDQGWEVKP